MTKNKVKSTNLTEGPILKKLILFSIPVILTGLLQQLYNAADMIVVGQWAADSETAMGAVGSCGALITLVVQLFMGLSLGAGVCVAHDIGAGNLDDVRRTVHTAIPLAAILGVIVAAFGVITARPLLALTGVEEPVLSQAVPYMQAYMLGIPASLVYNYCASMLRSNGDTTRPMIFLAISGLVNVICNFVAVIGFGLGAVGVGIATAISSWCAMIFIVFFMIKSDGILKFRPREMKIHKDKLFKIIRIGLPSGIQGSVFSIANVTVQSAVNGFHSTAILAGNTAASNVGNFVYTSLVGFYHTAISFVGQNMGARKLDRVKKITFQCMLCVTVLGVTLGGLVYIFKHPLLTLYGLDSAESFEAAYYRVAIVVATYFLCGLMDVICGVMRGMGNSTVPMIVSIVGTCAFRLLWIYTVFAVYPTLPVLYAVYPISWILTCIAHGISLFFIYKQKKRQFARESEQLPVSNTI